jgi:6-phosphofructo-2-kinase
MRLKLSGPDYKDKDPVKSLADFRERVKAYESAYVPLGDYEEDHGMQYIKVGALQSHQRPTTKD